MLHLWQMRQQLSCEGGDSLPDLLRKDAHLVIMKWHFPEVPMMLSLSLSLTHTNTAQLDREQGGKHAFFQCCLSAQCFRICLCGWLTHKAASNGKMPLTRSNMNTACPPANLCASKVHQISEVTFNGPSQMHQFSSVRQRFICRGRITKAKWQPISTAALVITQQLPYLKIT